MAAIQPFTWGANGQAISPEQLDRQRKVAEALMAVQPKPQTMWEGIQSAIGQIGGSALNARADAQEKQAQDDYLDEFDALGDAPSTQQLEKLAGNQFANPGQQAVVQALLSQQMQQQSPDYQLDLDLKRAQIQAAQAKPEAERKTATDQNGVLRYLDTGEAAFPSVQPRPSGFRTMTADEVKAMGLPPGAYQQDLTDQKISQIGGGGQKIEIGGNNDIGTIPPGYFVKRDADGNIAGMEKIPGGPVDAADQKRADQAGTSASIVVDDIGRTLDQITSNPTMTTGVGAALTKGLPGLPAYQTQALVDGIRANAALDKLQAAREASPTGGALGNVTEGEEKLLADAIGNLDLGQDTPQLTYNLKRISNLYRDIIDGKSNGPRYDLTAKDQPLSGDKSAPGTVPAAEPPAGAPPVGAVMDGYRFKGGDPAVQSNWEKL